MKSLYALVLPLMLLVASSSVSADPEDSWNLLLGSNLLRDSNLYRAPSGSAQSEEIVGTYLGVKVHKNYALQSFVVDAMMTDYRFSKNTFLDNVGKNLSAAWLWSLTPRFHGNLSTKYSEGLLNYTDYKPGTLTPATRRNVHTTTNDRFDAEWEALGRVRLLGGLSHIESKNSAPIYRQDNYTSDSLEYGVKYVMPSSSYLSLVGRNTKGNYSNRVFTGAGGRDTGFSEQGVELRFAWTPSEKSRFSGRVAHVKRENDNLSAANFSGPVGSLDYSLSILGKLTLLANFTKDLGSYQDVYSTYFSSTSYSLSPVWQISAKTALRARYFHEKRDYRGEGTIVTTFPSYPGYEDTLRQTSFSVDWAPLRTLTLTSSIQRATRDSTFQFARRDFASNTLSVSANLAF